MVEKSILDLAVEDLIERQRFLKKELQRRFKREKPFRMEPVSEDKQLSEYMGMTPELMDERIQRDGEEATGAYIKQMEALKEKRGYA